MCSPSKPIAQTHQGHWIGWTCAFFSCLCCICLFRAGFGLLPLCLLACGEGGMRALGHSRCWGWLTGVLSTFRAGGKELRLTHGKMLISHCIKLQTGLDSCSKSSCSHLSSLTRVSVRTIHLHRVWQTQHLSYKPLCGLAWSIPNAGGKTKCASFLNHTYSNTLMVWICCKARLRNGLPSQAWCQKVQAGAPMPPWRPAVCRRGRGSCICTWWFSEV